MQRVSIIIPHFNDLVGLDRCLNALMVQDFSAETVEIIVADNRSPQGLAAVENIVAGRARVIDAPERGAGPARNAGVAAATGSQLAFIDSDCVAEPQWLSSGLGGLSKYDFCGGPVHVLIDQPPPWTPAQAFEMVFAFDNERYVRDMGFTGSGNLFTTRAVFDDVGGFGVGLSEDLDWSHRATSKGYRLGFVPQAAIGHPARDDWPALRKKWLRIQSETYALRTPTLANRLRWLARTWALIPSIFVHSGRIFFHPGLPTASDRFAAFRGLIQLRLWRWWDGHRLLLGLERH